MAERKGQEISKIRIIAYFKEKAAEGWTLLTIPDVIRGLKSDRRRIEKTLAVMSDKENPKAKLVEIEKSRVKYYILKDVFAYCQKWMKNGND